MIPLTQDETQVIIDSLEYRKDLLQAKNDPIVTNEIKRIESVILKLTEPIRLQTWQEDH